MKIYWYVIAPVFLAATALFIVTVSKQAIKWQPPVIVYNISPELSSPVIRLKIKQAEVSLESAKGHVEHMKINLDRYKQLHDRRSASKEEYETHFHNYGKAVSDADKAKYFLAELQELLKVTEEIENKIK